VCGYTLPDLPALRAPDGTSARVRALLDVNAIAARHPAVRNASDRPHALRHTTTHDLHHVITGFDPGLAGELGVLAFYVGQGSAPIGRGLLAVGRLLYGLVSPTQGRRIWHNARLGLTLGQDAELVIAQPVESWFEEPLATVRARLRIPDPRAAGVLESGRSVIGDLVYPRAKPAWPQG
jgi:hypothetical protein